MSNFKFQIKRTLNLETPKFIGQEVLLKGWVKIRRDHGKLIFLDLWDRSGLVQMVVNPRVSEEAYKIAQELRPEFAIEVLGKVNKRPVSAVRNPKPADSR